MDNVRLWTTILSEIELLVTKATFMTFFKNSRLETLENAVATIALSSRAAVQMIENRYYSLIKNLLDKHTKDNNSLVFAVVTDKNKETIPGPLFMPPPASDSNQMIKSARLRSDFIFDTFAVSSSNQMAFAAATAVAASPGTSYNPLFIYGGVGIGKTHLMQAIGNEVLKNKPLTRVIYCMGEEFTNEIIAAIQTKTTQKFKDKYRGARILLLDDVQFLEGKIKIQEEFFYTFNAVQREGGQVVLTSDRPPHEIDRLEERLQSRFEGGLLVDMQKPDFELRCAILRIKAGQKNIDLPISVAQILAANSESVRRLEGFLTRLVTEAQVKKLPITEELAAQIVGKPMVKQDTHKNITPREVAEAVVKRFGVSVGQLKGPKRSRPVVRPRQVLMYLLRTELQLPLEEVGLWVGGRDHTTVIHAVETMSGLLSTNPDLRESVSWIKKEVFG